MAIHLGGSSRNSLAATREVLDKTLNGLSGDAASALSADLFAVVNALGQNVALRRAITDPSRQADEKTALLKDLFGTRISDKALALATLSLIHI